MFVQEFDANTLAIDIGAADCIEGVDPDDQCRLIAANLGVRPFRCQPFSNEGRKPWAEAFEDVRFSPDLMIGAKGDGFDLEDATVREGELERRRFAIGDQPRDE